MTKSKSLRRMIRRLVFDIKKNDFHCGEWAELCFFQNHTNRKGKLSSLSNVKNPLQEGTNSRSSKLFPTTILTINQRQSHFSKFLHNVNMQSRDTIRAKKYVLLLSISMSLLLKIRWIEWSWKNNYKWIYLRIKYIYFVAAYYMCGYK